MEQVQALIAAIAAWPLSAFMRGSAWAYPAAEVLHILGFAVLVGSIFVVDLRLLGMARSVPLSAVLRHVLPLTLFSLLAVVPSGLLLFAAHATDLAANPAFLVKLVLLAAAGLNALWLHASMARHAPLAEGASPPAFMRRAAGTSLAAWVGVIVAGRLIAYF